MDAKTNGRAATRAARRGRCSPPRPGPLCGRRAAAKSGVCVFRALAACLCPHRENRRGGGAHCAWRRQRADRQDAQELGSVGRHPPLNGRGGKPLVMPHRPALVAEHVMHVGEPVAMVVAESAVAAQDAAELVAVEYEPLTPVTDAREALRPGAPQLWPEAPGQSRASTGRASPPIRMPMSASRRLVRHGEIRRPNRGDEPAHGDHFDGAARRHRKL